ncbi:MAG: polyamine ABC transporter substrate-binding protein [Pseudomonadota bacterium]|nr:polyamine ABC transporter substrate-binding protein [Pseudomonadota bacterium]
MTTKTSSALLAGLAAGTAAIAPALVPAAASAAEEPVLYVYNWSDYIAEDTIEKFEAETGIKVTYDVFDSNEVLEAKLMAGSTGYDIVVPTGAFLARQIQAGVFQELDKSKLPNIKNMDPEIMARVAAFDPDNKHAVVYMWGTTAIGYNVKAIEERLGADAPVDSWALIFDPANAEKLADCGISMLDAPVEVIPAALNYLGIDPGATDKESIDKAEALLKEIAPHVRYFHSSQYINDLANGDVCLSVGWSGDVFQARDRAAEADNGVEIAYSVPKEGALMWFDMLAIPTDAPHPENALTFLNYLMDAQVAADITNYVWYANANAAATPLVDPEITGDPGIYPTEEAKAKLYTSVVYDSKADRLLNRAWTSVKTGH